jgi:hypothetical protein
MRELNERRHPRVVTNVPAFITTEELTLEGTIENLGVGGAFFATDSLEGSVEAGDPVTMGYRDPDTGEDVERAGTVLRIERYFHEGGLYRALAVKFDGG